MSGSARALLAALALVLLAGCHGRRSTLVTRQLVTASGIDIVELSLPGGVGGGETRLFTDISGEPLLVAPSSLQSLREGRPVPLDVRGVGSAVALEDGQWLAGGRGAVHLMRGGERVDTRTLAGPGVAVRVAPAGAVIAYVTAGASVGLLDVTGSVRRLARFRSPVTAVAGTGELTFVALESGGVWMLQLGERPEPLYRHSNRIESMAIDPSGYLVFADSRSVYVLLQGRPLPLVAGLVRPQLAATHGGFYLYSAEQRRLFMVRGVVDVEAAVAP